MVRKVVVVTGSASGMGLATATSLASSGAHLALWDINSSKLKEIAKSFKAQYSGKILAQTVDVSDRSAVKAALIEAQHHLGPINAIANFAGTGGHQLGVEPIWETSNEGFEFITNLNIRGLFNILGEALTPGFLGELQSIVHIASMFGTRGYKNGAVFAASKHAAVGMVKSAALEVGSRGIRVNCILPCVFLLFYPTS
jgi:NAD(P)-dependent dehydrogenase (short-subunit alcohol dehydrogenase family)